MPLSILEKVFISPIAIFLVMAIVITWLVKEYRRLKAENKELYDKIIHLLELRIAKIERNNPG
ncbi:hypothetical protein ES703_52931 [subsurface metagenome]